MANDTQVNMEDKLKERLTQILSFLEIVPEISTSTVDNVITVDVQTGRDDLFTRGGADPLLALQHLLRVILRHDIPESVVTVSLNIGDFQQHQRTRLATIAKDAINQARATKMAVYLPPMSSYERRLVHLALVDETGIVGESEGEGPDRRVVIKPI